MEARRQESNAPPGRSIAGLELPQTRLEEDHAVAVVLYFVHEARVIRAILRIQKASLRDPPAVPIAAGVRHTEAPGNVAPTIGCIAAALRLERVNHRSVVLEFEPRLLRRAGGLVVLPAAERVGGRQL